MKYASITNTGQLPHASIPFVTSTNGFLKVSLPPAVRVNNELSLKCCWSNLSFLAGEKFPCFLGSTRLPAGEITLFFFDDDRLLLMKVTSNLWQKRAYNSYMMIVAPINVPTFGWRWWCLGCSKPSRESHVTCDKHLEEHPQTIVGFHAAFPSIPGLQFTDHDTCIHVIYIYI